MVSQNQFPTSLDCFHICRVQQIQCSSDTIRISSVISGEDHSSCPEKVPGFILYFLFSLFSPYAHPIFIASEITLMGARKIYLFTYLKPTPHFHLGHWNSILQSYWIHSFCGIHSASAVAASPVGWSVDPCDFSLVSFCLFIRCLLCFSRPAVSCFHVTSNFSTQYWFSSLKLWWTQVPLVQPLCLHSCLHQSWLLCSDSCTALTTARQLVFNNADWSWLMLP